MNTIIIGEKAESHNRQAYALSGIVFFGHIDTMISEAKKEQI
jgi:hypothetical protein